MTLPARIRVNVAAPFPAMVTGQNGIAIGKQNGIWSVQLNTNSLATSTPPSTAFANDYVVVFDSTTGLYSKVALSTLTAGVTAGAGGTPGQVQYNNAGAFGGFTASGGATINTSTGVVSLVAGGTNNSLQYNNSGAFGGLGPLTNGQLLIGSTGVAAVPATLTAGSNVTITNAAGAITIASAGTSAGPADAFVATLSADQTGIASGVATKINFNTAGYNQNGKYNMATQRWIPSAGPVQIELQIFIGAGTIGNIVAVIYKNGTGFKQFNAPPGAAFITMSVVDTANGTDYYEAYVTCAGGTGPFTLSSSPTLTFFQGFAIAPQGPAGPGTPPATTVALLPTPSGGLKGSIQFVIDAIQTFTAANFGTTVTGGGANNVPVVCDGTNWKIG